MAAKTPAWKRVYSPPRTSMLNSNPTERRKPKKRLRQWFRKEDRQGGV